MNFGFIQNKAVNKWHFEQPDRDEAGYPLVNPMRGWYSIYTFQAERKPDFEELKWCLQKDESMALVIFDIGYYKNERLSEDVLFSLSQILAFFDENKRDVILRPVYDRAGQGRQHEPESFEMVMQHLGQIGEKLKEEPGSVVIFQGLLIGAWGEMHDSAYLSAQHLRRLSQCILPYLDNKIYLAVRTPAQWRQLIDEKSFNCSKTYPIALFDDGIFGSETHLGTFGMYTREAAGWQGTWMREEELRFENQVCLKVPCGGEALSSADGRIWSAEKMIREMQMMHLSYLNSRHDAKRLDAWKQMTWHGQNFYDYITDHLGYCFRISHIELHMKRGLRRKLHLLVEIKNDGFGACFYETEAALVLETAAEKKTIEVPVDLRQWMPGDQRQLIINLPLMSGEIYLTVRRKKDHRPLFFYGQKETSMYLGRLTY